MLQNNTVRIISKNSLKSESYFIMRSAIKTLRGTTLVRLNMYFYLVTLVFSSLK